MFMRNLKWRFIGSAFIALMLISLTTFTRENDATSSPLTAPKETDSGLPPIEQVLVPESAFAVQLANALKLSQTEDESLAESQLGKLGIEPKNGWISEYPVTPDVIGDIDKAVAAAADSGKLNMEKDQALKILADVKTNLGLNISAAPPASPLAPLGEPKVVKIYKYIDAQGGVHITDNYDSIPEEYRKKVTIMEYRVDIPVSAGITAGADALAQEYAATPDQQIVNNYYYTSGPPAVTYYPPPGPYYYLYSWVPYPFWSSGFFFRGFFKLHHFHKHRCFDRWTCAFDNRFDHDHFRHGQFSVNADRLMRPPPMGSRQPSPGSFYSPQIQNDARAILKLNDKRRAMQPISPGPRILPTKPLDFSRGLPRQPPNYFPYIQPWNRGIPQDFTRRMYQPPAFPNTTREFTFAPTPRISSPPPAMPRSGLPSSRRR